jgi:chemotaxis protein CheX
MASVKLPDVVDTASVGALRAAILEHRGGDLELDAGRVQRIGGLGLQVLAAAAATWRADGVSLTLAAASDPFNDMMRLMGAADLWEHSA